MSQGFSTEELIVYSLLNFLPYVTVALYPFRDSFRFSKKNTALLILLASFIQIILGLCAGYGSDNAISLISLVSTFLYIFFYFLCVKAKFGKSLFVLLMLSNISNFIVSLSKCIEGLLFPDMASDIYRWTFCVTTLFTQLVVLSAVSLFINRILRPVLLLRNQDYIWHYLWLVPSTFYLIWYYNIYFNSTLSSLQLALNPKNNIISFLINLGAFLIYYIIARMLSENNKNMQLENANHSLKMEQLQFVNLQNKISETRRARHDLRHYSTVIRSYIEQDDYPHLKEYLESFLNVLPDDTPMSFCENTVINVLISHFYGIAKDNNIDFEADVNIPASIPVEDVDLTVVVGNLIENAVYACISKPDMPKNIIIKGKVQNNVLLFTIDNTYSNAIRKDKSGSYYSTKHEGVGIGLESVAGIIERYNGVLKIEQHNNVFYISVMLQLL